MAVPWQAMTIRRGCSSSEETFGSLFSVASDVVRIHIADMFVKFYR